MGGRWHIDGDDFPHRRSPARNQERLPHTPRSRGASWRSVLHRADDVVVAICHLDVAVQSAPRDTVGAGGNDCCRRRAGIRAQLLGAAAGPHVVHVRAGLPDAGRGSADPTVVQRPAHRHAQLHHRRELWPGAAGGNRPGAHTHAPGGRLARRSPAAGRRLRRCGDWLAHFWT